MCDVCGKRPAVNHLTEVDDLGIHQDLHICAHCTKRLKLNLTNPPSIAEILNLDAAPPSPSDAADVVEEEEITCPSCGLEWSAFSQHNRFGCSDCYDAFRERLSTALKDVQGSDQHTGRRPGSDNPEHDQHQRIHVAITEHQRQLEEAIAKEDYEAAAGLRDQIAHLRAQLP